MELSSPLIRPFWRCANCGDNADGLFSGASTFHCNKSAPDDQIADQGRPQDLTPTEMAL